MATAMVGTNGTGMLALIGHDIQMPGTERFFLDPMVLAGFFGDTDAYIGGSWSMVPWTIDALVGKTFRVGPIGGERYSRATLAPDSKADPRS